MIAPASKWISVIYPDTRGRISTDSTGSSRPVNSSHSLTSFSTTVTTLTGSAGCCVTDAFLHPFAASNTKRKPTTRKLFFINDRIQAFHGFTWLLSRDNYGNFEIRARLRFLFTVYTCAKPPSTNKCIPVAQLLVSHPLLLSDQDLSNSFFVRC